MLGFQKAKVDCLGIVEIGKQGIAVASDRIRFDWTRLEAMGASNNNGGVEIEKVY